MCYWTLPYTCSQSIMRFHHWKALLHIEIMYGSAYSGQGTRTKLPLYKSQQLQQGAVLVYHAKKSRAINGQALKNTHFGLSESSEQTLHLSSRWVQVNVVETWPSGKSRHCAHLEGKEHHTDVEASLINCCLEMRVRSLPCWRRIKSICSQARRPTANQESRPSPIKKAKTI